MTPTQSWLLILASIASIAGVVLIVGWLFESAVNAWQRNNDPDGIHHQDEARKIMRSWTEGDESK